MNTDKAYLIGLIVGGGSFSSNNTNLSIKLPYKSWGDTAKNPIRAGEIATDILDAIKPPMESEYNLFTTYETGRDWYVKCHGDLTTLISDLASMGLTPSSEMWKTSDLSVLATKLTSDTLKKKFIAGVADTRGSTTPSQRRFSNDVQIISFEIPGYNYRLVCQLCNLLYSIGCIPDQILWQHPNMQSGKDAYYKSWKKGNKLRVTMDAFSEFGALAFRSKAKSMIENLKTQQRGKNESEKCETKELRISMTSVHSDEHYIDIPSDIRGGHYIHHKQFCAALNCEHAPFAQMGAMLKDAYKYICPFTILTKTTKTQAAEIIKNDTLLSSLTYTSVSVSLKQIIDSFKSDATQVINNGASGIQIEKSDEGYPLNEILAGAAYIIATDSELNGSRIKGELSSFLNNKVSVNPSLSVQILFPDKLSIALLEFNDKCAMVGAKMPQICKKIISFDASNPYKMYVRRPEEKDYDTGNEKH